LEFLQARRNFGDVVYLSIITNSAVGARGTLVKQLVWSGLRAARDQLVPFSKFIRLIMGAWQDEFNRAVGQFETIELRGI